MLQYRLIIVVLVVYTTLVDIRVSGDYQCLCSHSAVSAVYGTKQYTPVLGYMYSKDCKPTYPDHSATFAFYAVQFENKVGYIINTPGDISFKNCTGPIPTTDAVPMVTSTSAPSPSTTTVSISTPTKPATPTTKSTTPTTQPTNPTPKSTTTKPTTPTTQPTTPTPKSTTTKSTTTKPTTPTSKPTTRLPTTTRATKPTTTPSHSTAGRCPPHWTRYRNSCYFVELVHDLTQHGAENKCMQSHGHLAYIESSTEQHFLESYISSQSGYDPREEIWIGGERHNHNWYWNYDHRMTYTKWDPNNIDLDKDCLTFRGRGNFMWKPSNCDHNHMYVCELQLETVQLIG